MLISHALIKITVRRSSSSRSRGHYSSPNTRILMLLNWKKEIGAWDRVYARVVRLLYKEGGTSFKVRNREHSKLYVVGNAWRIAYHGLTSTTLYHASQRVIYSVSLP